MDDWLEAVSISFHSEVFRFVEKDGETLSILSFSASNNLEQPPIEGLGLGPQAIAFQSVLVRDMRAAHSRSQFYIQQCGVYPLIILLGRRLEGRESA